MFIPFLLVVGLLQDQYLNYSLPIKLNSELTLEVVQSVSLPVAIEPSTRPCWSKFSIVRVLGSCIPVLYDLTAKCPCSQNMLTTNSEFILGFLSLLGQLSLADWFKLIQDFLSNEPPATKAKNHYQDASCRTFSTYHHTKYKSNEGQHDRSNEPYGHEGSEEPKWNLFLLFVLHCDLLGLLFESLVDKHH